MTVVAAGLLIALLAGCGRRGELEPPLDPRAPAATSADGGVAPALRRPKRTLITPPQDSFILDPLL